LKRSNRVLLLLGVGLAVMAFIGVLAVGSMSKAPATPEVEKVAVVVATQDLPLGTVLTPEMMTTEERPVAQAVDTFASTGELDGTVIRRSVGAGHVLRTSDFESGSGGQAIAGSIGAGLRGVAVALDPVGGVGYLVQPGDFVDVVLTMADDNPVAVNNPAYPSGSDLPLILLDDWTNNTSVKVIVQNVQVLAVVHPTPAEDTNQVSTPNGAAPEVIVALAVSPQQAEAVRFGQVSGDVSLILRAPADRAAGETPTTGITLQELVDRWGVLPPAPIAP
jgi:pilus assembly protein CpaB